MNMSFANFATLDDVKASLYIDPEDYETVFELEDWLITDDLRVVFCGGYLCALKTLGVNDSEVEKEVFGSQCQFSKILDAVWCKHLRPRSKGLTPEQRERGQMLEYLCNTYRSEYGCSGDDFVCLSMQEKEERRKELLSRSLRPAYDAYSIHTAFVLGYQLAYYLYGGCRELPTFTRDALRRFSPLTPEEEAEMDALKAELQRILQEMDA